LISVKLAADRQAAYSSAVTWHDARYAPGSTVRIEARTPGGHVYPLGAAREHSGLNTKIVSVRSVPVGRYNIAVYVTNPAGTTTGALSLGPIIIRR